MRGPHGQHRKGRFGEGRQNKQATLSDTHPFRFVTSKVLVANVIQIQIQIQFQGGMQIQIRIQIKMKYTGNSLTSTHLYLTKCTKKWNQMFEGDLFQTSASPPKDTTSSNIDFVTEKNLDGAGCLNWDSIPRNVSEEITVDGCVIKHFPEKDLCWRHFSGQNSI